MITDEVLNYATLELIECPPENTQFTDINITQTKSDRIMKRLQKVKREAKLMNLLDVDLSLEY